MRSGVVGVLVAGLVMLTGCSDPLGTQRAQLLADIASLEQECELLGPMVEEVGVVRELAIEQTTRRMTEVERLRSKDECVPCGERLDETYRVAFTDKPVDASPPAVGAVGEEDPLDVVQAAEMAWRERRDEFRSIAENLDLFQRELGVLVEEGTTWDDPVCVPAACQVIREACRDGC